MLISQIQSGAAFGSKGLILGLLAAAAAIVAVKIAKRCRGQRECGSSGWKWVTLSVVALTLGITFLSYRHERGSIAQRQAEAARRSAEQLRTEVAATHEMVKLRQLSMQEAWDQVNPRQLSLQEAWDQVTRPRIDLTGDRNKSHSMSLIGSRVDATGVRAISDSDSDSLANSIQRLERAANQVATVAEQVADVGTLIGRAMIALNGTLGATNGSAQPTETAAPPPEPKTPAIAAADAKPVAAAAVAHSAKADVVVPVAIEMAEAPTADVPAWIDDPAKRTGNVWREVIITDEYVTTDECQQAADALLFRATFDHIQDLFGQSGFALPHEAMPATIIDEDGRLISDSTQSIANSLQRMGIGIDYIRREIAKDEYTETVQRSFGPMRKTYTLVEFSPSVDRELRYRWEEHLRRERFAAVGLGAGSVLSLIGLAYGLLKIDTWTKGYYSKRLFLGAPAAIIGAILALLTWKEVIF